MSETINKAASLHYEGYRLRLRRFNAGLLWLAGLGQWIALALLGGAGELPFILVGGILAYGFWLKTDRPGAACGCIGLTFPLLANSLFQKNGGQFDLYLAGLMLLAHTREFSSLAGFLVGVMVVVLSKPSMPAGAGDALFWAWGALLMGFAIAVSFSSRSENWKISLEQVRLQMEMETSSALVLRQERERTSRLQALLDEVLDFCRSVAASGHLLYDMGERQELGNRQSMKGIEEILQSTDSVLGSCMASGEALVQLQARTRDSLNVAHLGEAGVTEGRQLVTSIQTAATLVDHRLRVILGRNDQVSSLVKSLRKTAERVRVVSLHAAMEAERSNSNQHNFGQVAQEIRDLGNRLDVAALNVERILRGVEERVQGNLQALESFHGQLQDSLDYFKDVAQSLHDTHVCLSEADTRLQEGGSLLRRQEQEIRHMQECTREMEGRQRGGETARVELQSVLANLSNTLEQVSWAAAELG